MDLKVGTYVTFGHMNESIQIQHNLLLVILTPLAFVLQVSGEVEIQTQTYFVGQMIE